MRLKEREKRLVTEPDEQLLDGPNTPLPPPMPHHVADPTSPEDRVSAIEITDVDRAMPVREQDLASELETRQLHRIESAAVERLDEMTVPIPRDSEEELTRPRERFDLADSTEPVEPADHDHDDDEP